MDFCSLCPFCTFLFSRATALAGPLWLCFSSAAGGPPGCATDAKRSLPARRSMLLGRQGGSPPESWRSAGPGAEAKAREAFPGGPTSRPPLPAQGPFTRRRLPGPQAVLVSIVVSIPACHAGDRGSIPRRGGSFLPFKPPLSGSAPTLSLEGRFCMAVRLGSRDPGAALRRPGARGPVSSVG